MLDTAKVPYLNRLVTSGQRKDVCQMLQQIYRCYIKNQGDLHDKWHAIGMDAMGDLSCDRRNAWTKVVQISWRWRGAANYKSHHTQKALQNRSSKPAHPIASSMKGAQKVTQATTRPDQDGPGDQRTRVPKHRPMDQGTKRPGDQWTRGSKDLRIIHLVHTILLT